MLNLTHRTHVRLVLLALVCLPILACSLPQMRRHAEAAMFLAPDSDNVSPEALKQAQKVLQTRLNAVLDPDPGVIIDENTLLVFLFSDRDVETTKRMAAAVGDLAIFDSLTPLNEGQPVPDGAQPVLSGRDFVRAQPKKGQLGWEVVFTLSPEATRRFSDYTQNNIEHYAIIALDRQTITAPIIRTRITDGRGTITCPDEAFARFLAGIIQSGRLPFSLHPTAPTP